MITIARCSKPEEAHLVRMRLEAGGVAAVVQDENLVQLNWLLSNAVGGVRIQVDEADAGRARDILELSEVPEAALAYPACPACDSGKVRPDSMGRRLSYLSLLLFALPLPIKKWKMRCSSCNHTWMWKREPDA